MAKQNKNGKPVKNDDYVVRNAAIDMVLASIALVLIHLIDRSYSTADGYDFWYGAMLWGAIGGAVLTGIGVLLLALKKGGIAAAFGTAAFAVVAVASTLFRIMWVDATGYLYFFTIAIGVLYLIWLLYSKDFFTISLVTAACGGSLYACSKNGFTGKVLLFFAISVVLMAFAVVLFKKASENKGILRFCGHSVRLYREKQGPVLVYVFCAALTACLLVSAFAGAAFAHYCVYVEAGALFAAACYYTIRLN